MENNLKIEERKHYKIEIRITDGTIAGKPHDFIYAFAVEADSSDEANITLHRHLIKCITNLEKAENPGKSDKN